MTTETKNGTAAGEKLTAVYIPFKTFVSSLVPLKEGVPPKLDRTAWRYSHIVNGQVLSAYKFLGLVAPDGTTRPTLKALVDKGLETQEGKDLFAVLLKERYPKVIALAAQNDTIANFQAAMRELGVSGTTLEKAIRFWVDAAKAVGFKYPTAWDNIPRSMGIGNPKKRRATVGGQESEQEDEFEIEDEEEKRKNTAIAGMTSKMQVQLHGAVVTLSVVTGDLIQLAANAEDLKWFQEVIGKFNERSNK